MNGSTITKISQPTLAQALRSWLRRMLKMTQTTKTISIQTNSSRPKLRRLGCFHSADLGFVVLLGWLVST